MGEAIAPNPNSFTSCPLALPLVVGTTFIYWFLIWYLPNSIFFEHSKALLYNKAENRTQISAGVHTL